MSIALAALAYGGAAQAQVHAVQGTGTVVAGSASIDSFGGNIAAPRTNVFLSTDTAVINWAPTDTDPASSAAIDFLPNGGTVEFSSFQDFTVLNRILTPTNRAIGLNGRVEGLINFSGFRSLGGNVWFYSPTGIIAGGTSSFGVGGLILTANDIPFAPGVNGGITFGPNQEIQFTAAPGSQARVTVEQGARISNFGTDAYALLVGPGITQAGDIELDGAIGLVAAERASIIIQNSLFDIRVEVGTSVVDAIVHSGNTGRVPDDPVITGPQSVVLMATPQNTAITMLLGGELGAVATNATAADRAVIISGGYDYNDLTGPGLSFVPATTTPVDVQIGSATFHAETTALTTGSISVSPARGEAISFQENASLTAAQDVTIVADLDESITAAEDLVALGEASAQLRLGTTNSEAGSGASAASVDVSGNLTIGASVFGSVPGADTTGGNASIVLDAGPAAPTLSVGGTTQVVANGIGSGTSTAGGSAFGGTAQILVNGGTLSLGDTIIQADGFGVAPSLAGPAGNGTGGTAQFVANGGAVSVTSFSISANGIGHPSNMGAPGSGRGGTATLALGGATFLVTGGSATTSTISAEGIGGSGDAATNGPGGAGTGGLAAFTATDTPAYALGDLAINANGVAGDSSGPVTGTGTGGTARFVNQGAAASTSGRTVGFLSVHAGGSGLVNGDQLSPDAIPGFAQFSDLASGANGRLQFANVDLVAQGNSAPAGTGVLVESAGGPLAINNNFAISSAGTVTLAVSGNAPIQATGTLAISSDFGDIVVTHSGQAATPIPTITAQNLLLEAAGSLTAGVGTLLTASQTLTLSARNGAIVANDLLAGDEIGVHALGNVSLRNATTTGPFVVLTDGSLAGGLIEITAGAPLSSSAPYQPFDIVISGTVTASGQLQAHAGRDILSSAGPPLRRLEGERVLLLAEGDIAGANLAILSRGDLNMLIGRDLLVDTVDVAGTPNMVNLLGQVTPAGQINVPGALSIDTLNLRGAAPGLLRAGGNLTIGDARTASLDVASTSGVLTIGSLAAFGGGPSGFLTATAPTVSITGIDVSGPLTATATQASLSASNITGGSDVTLAAGSDLSASNVNAADALTMTTPATISIGGTIAGASITANSADLVIASGGQLGSNGTALLELSNNSTSRTFYGGSDNAGGYSLSAAEIAQLRADDITLIAPLTSSSGPSSPDVTVGTMAVTGRATSSTGQLGSQGTFTIDTPGRVLVNGAVTFTDLMPDNSFAIRGGGAIVIDNQAGSVDLRGSGNALGGTIDFSADSVMALSSTALAALANLSDPAAIDALLGANDGAVNDDGVLRAGGMRFAVTDSLYIQNTGAGTDFDQRRGFTVGADGLVISSFSAATPLIVINGQATAASGGFVTGLDTIPLVTINGQPAPASSGTHFGSTINGCDFTSVVDCTQGPSDQVIAEITPTRDRVEGPVEERTGTPADRNLADGPLGREVLVMPEVELGEFGRMTYEPLIDEPVTGSGNDDLWLDGCDPARDGSCPASGEAR